MASFGEAGSLITNSPTANTPITVSLTEPLTNPVIALTSTQNGEPFTMRIVSQTLDANGDTTAFSFIIEEWEYLDGAHSAYETVNWLAVEPGVHTLPDGRVIEAGTASADESNTAVSLNGGFTSKPVVLTSVMSNNDAIAVDSDPVNVTSSGFNVRLQQEEAQRSLNNHANETVGYIAVQTGGNATDGTATIAGGQNHNVKTHSLGATFTSPPVVLTETQTINGGDTATLNLVGGAGTSHVSLALEEVQSRDSETAHINETVGIVAFSAGQLFCFADGTHIDTPLGARLVEDLEQGDLVYTQDEGIIGLDMVLHRSLSSADLAAKPALRPVRIRAGALGNGLPERDLRVSQQHRMIVNAKTVVRMFDQPEVLVAAKMLVGLDGIEIEEDLTPVTYFHLVLEDHNIVFAEGTPTESFYPTIDALKSLSDEARTEFMTLFPDFSAVRKPSDMARKIPDLKRQKRLVERLAKNQQFPLG